MDRLPKGMARRISSAVPDIDTCRASKSTVEEGPTTSALSTAWELIALGPRTQSRYGALRS